MGRRKKGGHRKKAEESDYDSDDPRAYAKEKTPDPSSRDFMYDEIDEFQASKEKLSLDVGRALEPAGSSDEEAEEVLGWDDEDDEEEAILKERLQRFRRQEKMDEMGSDLEDDEEDDEGDDDGDEKGVSSKAWGKRKQAYYDTDYVDDDLPGLDQIEETVNQEAEEKEALAIQTRMAQALQDDDFGLDIFKSNETQVEKTTTDDLDNQEKVTKDLSKLSKRDKLELLKKESPEFLQLIADFKLKMRELIDRLQPLVALIKKDVIPQGSEEAQYIHTKYQLYLSYCMNISFYMILKAKHVPVANHPVIGRIVAFGKLISELKPVDEKLEEEIEAILNRAEEIEKENKPKEDEDGEQDEEILHETRNTDKKRKKKRKHEDSTAVEPTSALSKKKNLASLSEEELKALEYYKTMETKQKEKKRDLAAMGDLEDVDEDEEEDGEEKRGITYQISKNKGLTAYRRKELRNPRVKNRMKFRKAKIRRKGQVRAPRTELQRYGGEASGIRSGVIKSVKIR